ncbi:hypothetical protein [Halomarina oriensis]|uniref:Uncharacterized protein n=1 Tax=Halomarina oriensis TaxID=671145 RepID=A0A6B0GVZ9_9EURY|nr:hypothetical protein [Halomarina oriensis]MWG35908.1 hypothetical protein [Halomarina oriensis]
MTEYPGLPTAITRFYRSFLLAGIQMLIAGAPFAAVVVILFAHIFPEAAPYGLLSAVNLGLLSMLNQIRTNSESPSDSETAPTSEPESIRGLLFGMIVMMLVLWATMVVVGGTIGYLLAYRAGLPYLAIVGAVVFPLIDDELGQIHPFLSPSVLARYAVFSPLYSLGLIDDSNEFLRRSIVRSSAARAGQYSYRSSER